MRESTFETEICEHLAANGWLYSPDDTGYDKDLALFPEDVFGWLADTQPERLAKRLRMTDPGPKQAQDRAAILKALAGMLGTPMQSGGGTLTVLRKGFSHIGTHFDMVQALPTETLNATLMDRYSKVRLRVMRQVHYSTVRPNRSIDLVLFCNGLPVATIELKTDFTQSVTEGMVQYAQSRQPTDPGTDHKEPLLAWGERAVVHFVVTNQVVAMTTRLDGPKTVFLPFNKGYRDGAGNPPTGDDSDTAYFWDEILDRDMWLKILTKYLLVKTEDKIDPATGTERRSVSIRFPRFHQLDAVERIVSDAYANGVGQRYLIEHSAGSGKTDTIVWTAHRLSALHDQDNKKVFDSVIVVTDRTVLDDQMSRAMYQLDHKQSQVKAISGEGSSKSKELAEALASRTPIIVVTIQTAPFALDYLRTQAETVGGRFAVIADEAHSSQTGDAAAKLREVLTPEEQADLADGGEVDSEMILAAAMHQRASAKNISYLAFTATPKARTLELFGRPGLDGVPVSFHQYSMRQAIDEGFILDVLTNYTPYKSAFKVAYNGQDYDSETIDKSKAMKSVMQWVRLHPYNISQKVQIIVEHFRANIAHGLGGNAKAMVVTGSRKEALRYYTLLCKYIEQQGYTDVQALVAFSGTVTDDEFAPDGVTESQMNPNLKGKKIDVSFNGPDYQVLIVANKYQVGFDQPLLTAMYVDKRLAGVMAVQTLSRLNRTWPGKDTVYVLDFVNDPEGILEAFKPYFQGATLTDITDPNIITTIAAKLDHSDMYEWEDVEKAATCVALGQNSKLSGAISKPVHRFTQDLAQAKHADDHDELERLHQYRADLNNYIKAYAFLSQIVDYDNTELEKRYIFYRALTAVLNVTGTDVAINLSNIVLTHHRVQQGDQQKLDLEAGEATPLTPMTEVGSAQLHDPENAQWGVIIEAINELFAGTTLSEADRIANLDLTLRKAKQDPDLVEAAKHNTDQDFHHDSAVVTAFIEAVLAVQESNVEFTDTVLKDQNYESLVKFLDKVGFRKYLAGDDDQVA